MGKDERQVAVFGWGVVAPGARNLDAFRALLVRGETALRPARGFGAAGGLFEVGDPDFDFADYRSWVVARGGEPRFAQLAGKMGDNALFAIGAFIQALGEDPALESTLRDLDQACHVYVGSGVGDLPQSYAASETFQRASRVWNRFWADPVRNAAARAFQLEGTVPGGEPPPPSPDALPIDSEERFEARAAWDAYWAARSDHLAKFLVRYAEIERTPLGRDDHAAPLHAIRARERAHRKLADEVQCPTPPWLAVDPKLVWAIQNVPAAQISMLLGTHGAAWAPVGACSTFGVALQCGLDAIRRGDAKAAIVGTTDPRPDPTLISAFHRARLAPATGKVNFPFTSLFGTHVAGGACIWILGDVEAFAAKGIRPVGPVVESVAVSSDAEHIITPSATGPKHAISRALDLADVRPDGIALWDMHATGTPGDLSELKLVKDFLGTKTAISAMKGIFGHGMSNGGGWELTAVGLALTAGRSNDTGIRDGELHPAIARDYGRCVVTRPRPLDSGCAVKVTLGIGGITACVVLGKAPRTA